MNDTKIKEKREKHERDLNSLTYSTVWETWYIDRGKHKHVRETWYVDRAKHKQHVRETWYVDVIDLLLTSR